MEKGRGLGVPTNRSSLESEMIVKMTRDLEILSSKLSDIRGTSTAATTNTTGPAGSGQKQAIAVVSSSFVSGIRKATELGNPGDDRLSVLDRIVEKVTGIASSSTPLNMLFSSLIYPHPTSSLLHLPTTRV